MSDYLQRRSLPNMDRLTAVSWLWRNPAYRFGTISILLLTLLLFLLVLVFLGALAHQIKQRVDIAAVALDD